MRLPGFTSTASLGRSRRNYMTLGGKFQRSSSTVPSIYGLEPAWGSENLDGTTVDKDVQADSIEDESSIDESDSLA